MEPKHTFRLALPNDKQVEVHLIELEDGTLIARTADELKAAAAAKDAAPRG